MQWVVPLPALPPYWRVSLGQWRPLRCFPGLLFFGRGAEAGRDADGFALKYWMGPDAGDRDTVHDDRGTEGGKMGTISSTHVRHKYLRPVPQKVLGGYLDQQLWDVVEHLFFLVVCRLWRAPPGGPHHWMGPDDGLRVNLFFF